MSVSTDGILFFGYIDSGNYDDEDPLFEALNAESFDEWEPETAKFLKDIGVEIGQHCSDQYPLKFVCVTDSYQRAWRGYPQQIVMFDATEKKIEWTERLKKLCDKLGVTPKKEPDFWLCSWWG